MCNFLLSKGGAHSKENIQLVVEEVNRAKGNVNRRRIYSVVQGCGSVDRMKEIIMGPWKAGMGLRGSGELILSVIQNFKNGVSCHIGQVVVKSSIPGQLQVNPTVNKGV